MLYAYGIKLPSDLRCIQVGIFMCIPAYITHIALFMIIQGVIHACTNTGIGVPTCTTNGLCHCMILPACTDIPTSIFAGTAYINVCTMLVYNLMYISTRMYTCTPIVTVPKRTIRVRRL